MPRCAIVTRYVADRAYHDQQNWQSDFLLAQAHADHHAKSTVFNSNLTFDRHETSCATRVIVGLQPSLMRILLTRKC